MKFIFRNIQQLMQSTRTGIQSPQICFPGSCFLTLQYCLSVSVCQSQFYSGINTVNILTNFFLIFHYMQNRYLYLTQVFELYYALSGASLVTQKIKNLPVMWGIQVQSLGWGRSSGEGHSNTLQYSCLENPMDRGVWQAPVDGVRKSLTRLSN